jgi:subtilase family serine protease
MGRLRVVRAVALALIGVCAGGVAWASDTASRVGGDVDEQAMVLVAGSVSPRVMVATDLGAAEESRKLPLMSLQFAMTPGQQAELAGLIAEQQRPGSAEYRRWLTPEQFRARFGMGAGDLAAVSGWLAEQGFAVTAVARSGLFVRFSGTVGQANRAFGVELHEVMVGGERHLANLTAASLPEGIAGVTAAITGLDDLGPAARVQAQVVAGALTAKGGGAASSQRSGVKPEYTLGGVHSLAPGDLYTIYDENAALTSNITGAGVTIAVVGQTDINLADIADFRAASGLAANVPTVALYGADPGATTVADLLTAEGGIEWAGAAAPGASLLYVSSISAIDGSLTSAIDNNVAPIIVDNYGQCEAGVGASKIVFYNQIFELAATEGITVVSGAGGSGATDCDANVASATHGLAVDFPASSPYVTGVGGTEFNEGGGTYFGATNGAHSGSALSYIPEKVWNDDSSTGLAAGGGGASLYFSKPSWQQLKSPVDYSRDVPDVALSASASHDGYLVCLPGYCANGFLSTAGAVDVAGGTPIAAAAFAGLLALVEQKTGARIGLANPTLYALGASGYAGSVFHDVTTGTNASPCTAGSTGCVAAGTIGYAAGAGYDLATGWGAVDAFNLVNDWALVTPLATTGGVTGTYVNLAASASPVAAGTAVTLTVTVASAVSSVTATPTGSVQFQVDGVAVGSAVVLGAGSSAGAASATYSLATGSLSVGSHTVQGTYLGDSVFLGSKGAFLLAITTSTPPDFSLTPATATVTVKGGGISPGVVFTVAAVNGFQGSVQFAASSATALAGQTSFSVNPVVISSTVTSGTTTFLVLAYEPLVKRRGGSTPMVESSPKLWRGVGSGIALAGLLMLVLPRRRRLGRLLLAVVGCVALGVSGCQSGTTATAAPTTVPTPAGTYAVTITGTATVNGVTTAHSAAVTFVVQ